MGRSREGEGMLDLGRTRARRLAVGLALGCALVVSACQSGPPPSLVEQGDAAFALGEYEAADDLYGRALAADPAASRAWHGRARIAVARGEGEAALRFHSALARRDRAYWREAARADYASALALAGRSRLSAGRAEASLEALRALAKLEPDWPGLSGSLSRSLVARAEELAMHGFRKEALALYQEAYQVDPGATRAYVGAAEILIGTGRKREALEILETARQIAPGDSGVRALTMEAMGLY